MYKKVSVVLLYLCFFIFLANFSVISESPSSTQTASPPSKESSSDINSLISQLTKYDINSDEFWSVVAQIESIGKDGVVQVRNGLENPDIKIRIGCANVMYQLGFRQESLKTIITILSSPAGEVDKQVFSTAAEVLGNLITSDGGGDDIDRNELSKKVQSILDETLDANRRLSLAKLWFELDKSALAVKEVKEIANLKDPQIRLSAALILALMDQFEKSKNILKELSLDPTPSGRLAKALLKYKEMQDAYARKIPKTNIDYSLLDEVIGRINAVYVDPSQLDIKKLLTAAAKGIAGSLDRYSEYQDEVEKKRSQESISMKYGGIGAYVNTRDNYLTIERPMYGQPAYQAGLRALDRITEVEGESTLGKDLNYLVNKLKGDPGTTVKIKVFRRGWTKEQERILTRAIVNVKTARYEILPGNIGYLSIVSFGTNTALETKQCLEEMKGQSVKAIIIDVRRNPGGLLNVVNYIVDLFIENDKTIVTTRDKNTVIEEFKTINDDKIDVPLYVLIDEGSASASEIFSGVLQDYHKAILIGATSYGKGSVQRVFDIETTSKQTSLKLTVAKYYLPSGRSIHKDKDGKGGVEPDIKISPAEQDLGKASEFNKLLDSGELDKYFDEYYPKNKMLFQVLADDDGENYERYPDFEQLYQHRVKARLEKDELRQALREHLRRKIADEREKEFLVDSQTDLILQRAIIEACHSPQVTIDPETIPAYKKFAHKFDKTKESSAK